MYILVRIFPRYRSPIPAEIHIPLCLDGFQFFHLSHRYHNIGCNSSLIFLKERSAEILDIDEYLFLVPPSFDFFLIGLNNPEENNATLRKKIHFLCLLKNDLF